MPSRSTSSFNVCWRSLFDEVGISHGINAGIQERIDSRPIPGLLHVCDRRSQYKLQPRQKFFVIGVRSDKKPKYDITPKTPNGAIIVTNPDRAQILVRRQFLEF